MPVLQKMLVKMVRESVGRMLMILLTVFMVAYLTDNYFFRDYYSLQVISTKCYPGKAKNYSMMTEDEEDAIDAREVEQIILKPTNATLTTTTTNTNTGNVDNWFELMARPNAFGNDLERGQALWNQQLLQVAYMLCMYTSAVAIYIIFIECIYKRKLLALTVLACLNLAYLVKLTWELCVFQYFDQPWELATHDLFDRGAYSSQNGRWVTFEEHVASMDYANAFNHEARPNIFVYALGIVVLMLNVFYNFLLRLEMAGAETPRVRPNAPVLEV